MRLVTLLPGMLVSTMAGLNQAVPTSSSAQQPELETPSEYSWVFDSANSDEFAVGGGLSKWDQKIGEWIGTPPAAFVDENAFVSQSSSLVLKTVDQPGFTPPGEPPQGSCDCDFHDITTAMVVSAKPMKHGFYEISAKFAKASLLNAFWLQGQNSEINALEVVPSSTANGGKQVMSSNVQCFVPGGDPSETESVPAPLELADSIDATQWHTYGLDWQEDAIKFYVDGKPVRDLDTALLKTAGCLDEQMSVILSVETQTAEGLPDFGSSDELRSEIAYFRHWTRGPKTTKATTQVPSTTVVTPSCYFGSAVQGVFESALHIIGSVHKSISLDACTKKCTATASCSAIQYRADNSQCKLIQDATPQEVAGWTTSEKGAHQFRDTAVYQKAYTMYGRDVSSAACIEATTQATAPPSSGKSAKSCAAIGYSYRYGNKDVCGHSSKRLGAGGANVCHNKVVHSTANEICTGAGARLCTADELGADATRGTGCGHDNRRIWTSTGCTVSDGTLGFLAVAGRENNAKKLPPQCLAVTSSTPAVRCCADRVPSSSGSFRLAQVGMLVDEEQTAGNVAAALGSLGGAIGVPPMNLEDDYDLEAQDVFNSKSESAAMMEDPYGEGSADDSSGSGGGGGGAAGAASAAAVALLAGVVLVAAMVTRSRKQRLQKSDGSDAIESGGRRRSSGGGTAEFETVRNVCVDTVSLCRAAEEEKAAVEAAEDEAEDKFEEQEYLYSPGHDGSVVADAGPSEEEVALRFKSVRRCNPAYVQSIVGTEM